MPLPYIGGERPLRLRGVHDYKHSYVVVDKTHCKGSLRISLSAVETAIYCTASLNT